MNGFITLLALGIPAFLLLPLIAVMIRMRGVKDNAEQKDREEGIHETPKKQKFHFTVPAWAGWTIVILVVLGTIGIVDHAISGKELREAPARKIGVLPAPRNNGPHTQIREVAPDVFDVSIDGTNEPDEGRNGHDTGLTLNPGECALIGHTGGHLSYMTGFTLTQERFAFASDPISGGRSYAWLTAGDQIRYRVDGTGGNAVYIVLRGPTPNLESRPQKFSRDFETLETCNTFFTVPARVFLFFNSTEYFVDRLSGEKQDGFRLNGWDGSRAVFRVARQP